MSRPIHRRPRRRRPPPAGSRRRRRPSAGSRRRRRRVARIAHAARGVMAWVTRMRLAPPARSSAKPWQLVPCSSKARRALWPPGFTVRASSLLLPYRPWLGSPPPSPSASPPPHPPRPLSRRLPRHSSLQFPCWLSCTEVTEAAEVAEVAEVTEVAEVAEATEVTEVTEVSCWASCRDSRTPREPRTRPRRRWLRTSALTRTRPAALCNMGCSPMQHRLQPHVPRLQPHACRWRPPRTRR